MDHKKVMEDMRHLVETFRVLLACEVDDEVCVTLNDKELVFQRIK
jgi:hypothetical protein